MNARKYLLNNNFTTVPNPNYDPNSEENNEEYLVLPDNNSKYNKIFDVINKDVLNRHSISSDKIKRYDNAGVQWNYRDYINESLDKQLYDSQSALTKLGNGLLQGVWSTGVIGTIKAFPDLIDAIGQVIFRTEHDYTSPISAALEEYQNYFNDEVAPIYTMPGVDIANGGLTNAGWWASNIPNIMTSITMLVPSLAVVKGVKLAGKGIKMARLAKATSGTKKAINAAKRAKELNRMQKLYKGLNTSANYTKLEKGAEIFGTALLSRTIENYQESHQIYDDMYVAASGTLSTMDDETYLAFLRRNSDILKGVNTNDRTEVAKAITRKSADRTFIEDYTNIVFDIAQVAVLRNFPFKPGKNAPKSASLYRANKNRIKYAGLDKGKKALAIEGRSFGTKVKDKLEDIFVGGKTVLAAELSEGVEEAVNYVAQQEGMNLGHVILGDKDDSVFGKRLAEYMQAPALWESAFWGVLGGVAFQGLGSAYHSGEARIHNAIQSKKGNIDSKTKERKWSELWETAELKRRKADMEQDEANFNAYIAKMEEISNNNSISDSEKQILKDKAYSDFITEVVIRNLNNGNYNMLQEYLSSDEIRDVLVNKGILRQTDAATFKTDVISQMNKIEKLYNQHLNNLNDISAKLNVGRVGYIPMEYLQIIATDNTRKQLKIDDWNRELNNWIPESEEQKQFFQDKLDAGVDYKSAVKLVFLTRQLGELEADKKALLEDKTRKGTIAYERELEQLNLAIESYKDLIYNLDNTDTNNGFKGISLLFAIENSMRFRKNGEDSYNLINDEDYNTFRKNLLRLRELDKIETSEEFTEEDKNEELNKLQEYFENIDGRLLSLNGTDIYSLLKIESNVNNSFAAERDIRKTASDLYTTYYRIADLETAIALQTKDIKKTTGEVSAEIDRLNNEMDELRVKAVDTATNSIWDLADKYGSDKILQAFRDRYNNKQVIDNYFGEEDTAKNDAKIFNDALDVLNLDSVANKNLAVYIEQLLENFDDIKAAQNAAQNSTNTTSQNSISATNPPASNNPTQQQPNAPKTQAKQQQTQNTPPQQPKTNPNELKDNGVTYAILHENGDLEDAFDLEIVPGQPKALELLNDDEYFDKNGVSLIDDFKIKIRPVVGRNDDGSLFVVSKGVLTKNEEEVAPEATNKSVTEPTAISSTGKRKLSYDPETDLIGEDNVPIGVIDDTVIPPDNDVPVGVLDDVIPPQDDDISEDIAINNVIFVEINEIRKKNKAKGIDTDWNQVRDDMVTKYKNSVTNSATLGHAIDSSINMMKRLERRNKPNAVEEVLLKSTTTEQSKQGDFLKEYQEAVDKLVEKYIEDIAGDFIDGKYYIRLEDLLRYCNAECGSIGVSNLIYQQMYEYLSNSDKYVLYDNDLNNVLINSAKSVELRSKEVNQALTYGINFDGLLRRYVAIGFHNEINKVINAINNLNVGDKLNYRVENKGIKFEVNGVVIGELPLPFITDIGGHYQYNNGWKTDVYVNKDGTIQSEFKDLLKSWFLTTDNDDAKRLVALAAKTAFTKLTDVQINALVQEFKANPEIIKAKEKGFTKDNVTDKELLIGLGKLFGLTRQLTDLSKAVTMRRRADSLDEWFVKVAESFDMIENLVRQGNNLEIVVDSVNNGEIIYTKEAHPVSTAIGKLHKGKCRIGVVGTTDVFSLAGDGINGALTMTMTKLGVGNTRLIIPNKNGYHAVVGAFPQSVSSPTLSKNAKGIVSAINAEITRICEEETISLQGKYANLENFLRTLLMNSKNNIKLFNITGKGLTKIYNNGVVTGFNLNYIDETGHAQDYSVAYNNSNTADVAKNLIKIINDYAKFNININHVKSDSNKSTKLDGFATRNDKGEFIITIPNQGKFTFASYNDFIIDNNIVLVNTEPNEYGSNYNTSLETTNPLAKPDVQIRIVSRTLPVEDSNAEPKTIPTDTIAEKVSDILQNSKSDTAGAEIAKTILGDKLKELKINNKLFDLFPKHLIFVNKNIGANAAFNPNDKDSVYVGENKDIELKPRQTVVGLEFMAMINGSINQKKQAVRKLIHERLHDVVHTGNNSDYVERVREVFDEFKKYIEDNNLTQYNQYLYNNTTEASNRYWKDGKLTIEGLEEFLVDSITSEELQDALNLIVTENEVKGEIKKKSLLQRIIEHICDMFGWNINEGSLFEKEFKLLSEAMSGIETKEEIKEITKSKEPIQTTIDFDNVENDSLNSENEIETKSAEDKVEKQPEIEETRKEEPVQTEKPVQTESNSAFDNFETDSLFDDMLSTTVEYAGISKKADGTVSGAVTSIPDFVDGFPIDQQADVIKKINNGDIQIVCR